MTQSIQPISQRSRNWRISRLLFAGALPLLLACGGGGGRSDQGGNTSPAPIIATQPSSQSVTNGSSVTFTGTATSATGYQWERSLDGLGWADISGATSSSYTFVVQAADTGSKFRLLATNSGGSTYSNIVSLTVSDAADALLGPNVYIFDSSTAKETIQSQCEAVFQLQGSAQFGSDRKVLAFKPGSFETDVHVGFYTQVLGLGTSPDDVQITGGVRSTAYLWSSDNHNATCNFWRGCENLALTPSNTFGGTNMWAVAQATPFRRMHIKGNLVLHDARGWASGGTIMDSKIDGNVDSGSQQQWISRNAEWGSWSGSNWNMVFVGVDHPPTGTWPNPPYTTVNQTPVVREKPFLKVSESGAFQVFVPALRTNSNGTTWSSGAAVGETLDLSLFHIAKPEKDTAATLNAALNAGKHLLFTPGIYNLDDTIRVTQPNTVVLGLGFATLKPTNGVTALSIADVDGVKVAGFLIDAGATNSPLLMEVGAEGSSVDHSANPTSLHDLFFRIGGAGTGKADVSLRINSHNVIGDHFWIWRADHGTAVGWNANTTQNGLIVNGDDVTIYGLFVEHYHQYQTIWNGERGRVYFYQSEIPYDVPSQSAWMNGSENGYASYKVADSVTTHEAWGLGIYCYFRDNPSVKLGSAIEVPNASGIKFHHMATVSLGGNGEITHVINDQGGTVRSGSTTTTLSEFAGQ